MDVLSHMIFKAGENSLLQRPPNLHLCVYVLFHQPLATNINLSLDILNLFGEASGQKTNVQKSNVFPIQCSENDMTFIQDHLLLSTSESPFL